jgi:hypothetical protein
VSQLEWRPHLIHELLVQDPTSCVVEALGFHQHGRLLGKGQIGKDCQKTHNPHGHAFPLTFARCVNCWALLGAIEESDTSNAG